MEFKLKENTNKNQWISTTGYRIFIEFKALLEAPRTIEEILEIVRANARFQKNISKDTVRFDINTLRRAGCYIDRPTKGNQFKYRISSHPFNLNIKKEELKLLVTLRENLLDELALEDVFILNNLYEKISALTFDEDILQYLSNSKPLAEINMELLKEISNPKFIGKKVYMEYNSPAAALEQVVIIPKKIIYENKKIYVLGFNLKYNNNSMFELSRIKKINAIELNTTNTPNVEYNVVFEVEGEAVKTFELKPNEKILQETDKNLKVEAKVVDEFMFTQRLLLLGSSFKIVSPDFYREKLINKIKLIRKGYEHARS